MTMFNLFLTKKVEYKNEDGTDERKDVRELKFSPLVWRACWANLPIMPER